MTTLFIRFLIAALFCCAGMAQTIYVPQFGHGVDGFGNSFSTSVSFINLANTTARVDIKVFNQSGAAANLLRRTASPFEPAAAVSEAGTEIAPLGFEAAESSATNPAAGVQVGWAEINADAPVEVEVLFSIRDASTGNLTTSTSIIPTAPVTAASFIAFAGAGANTGVALLNLPVNQAAAVVSLSVIDRLGRTVGESELTLQPGAQTARFLSEIVAGLESFSGTFELRSNVPVAVLPLRQDGIELTTQVVHPGREFFQ